jgi:hypothetical protein
MAEVIHVFEHPLTLDNVAYTVQVCGRPAGNIWEGWIEFLSDESDDVRRTRRETTQPTRSALEYWAGGLSATYLEGAMQRTFDPPPIRQRMVRSRPQFDGPAEPLPPYPVVAESAILDPFSVGAKGEDLLRRELGALADWHLRNIVRVYELADESVDIEQLSQAELIELIVSAVDPV